MKEILNEAKTRKAKIERKRDYQIAELCKKILKVQKQSEEEIHKVNRWMESNLAKRRKKDAQGKKK